jgi:hypothetical protein
MHRRLSNLQLLICCSFISLLAGCAVDVVPREREQQTPLRKPVIAYFEDSSRAMSLEDILQPMVAAEFRPYQADRVANFGMSESAIWGRIDVTADESVTLVVELSTTRLDHVTWWEVQDSEIVGEIRNGWYDGKPGAPAPQKYPSIYIDIPDGQTSTVICRITSDCSLTLPLTIEDTHNYQETCAARGRYDHFQIGATFSVICLCLLLAATFRDWNYVYLALCCTAGVIYGLTFDTALSIPTVQLPPWCSRVGCSLLATFAAFWMLVCFVHFGGLDDPRKKRSGSRDNSLCRLWSFPDRSVDHAIQNIQFAAHLLPEHFRNHRAVADQ